MALADVPGMEDAAIWRRSPAFWAKDDAGRPRTGHEHAFFLPTDDLEAARRSLHEGLKTLRKVVVPA